MLIYQPGFDPYHAIHRFICLLTHVENFEPEVDKLRILDFFYLFPAAIKDIRVPREMVALRSKLSPSKNVYQFSGKMAFVFRQITPYQDAALRTMLSKGLITRKLLLTQGLVRINSNKIPKEITDVVTRNKRDALLTFLTGELATIPLGGRDGLRDRSGLMEFRYDTL